MTDKEHIKELAAALAHKIKRNVELIKENNNLEIELKEAREIIQCSGDVLKSFGYEGYLLQGINDFLNQHKKQSNQEDTNNGSKRN